MVSKWPKFFFVKWSSFETTTYPPKTLARSTTSIKKFSFLFIFELLAHLFARMKNKILLDKITVGRAQSCLIANHLDQNPDSLMEVNFTWMWQYILSFCPPWQWTNKKCKFCVFSKDPFVVEKYSIHWAQLTFGYFRTVWFISGNPCKDPSPCRTVFFLESLLFTERPDKDPDSVYFFPHQLHLIFFVNTSGFCSMKSSFCCQPTRKTCLFASRLAKSSYECWLLVITISTTVSRSSPHLPFFSLAMFVTGSEWPMSAWDFTSTVTESGVTWGFDCCQPRQEFWLLPTGKNLYFQQIAFRIATHLTRWAPVLAGMSWRHRCDRQRGTHRTGGQRWHNDLTIKLILYFDNPT